MSGCGICFNEYNHTQHKPLSFPCGHVYCESCINELKETEDCCCPECRRDLSKDDISKFPVIYCLLSSRMDEETNRAMQIAKMFLEMSRKCVDGFKSSAAFEKLLVKGLEKTDEYLQIDSAGKFEILVKDLRGRSTPLQVKQDDTIESMRQLLQLHIGIPPEQQLLLFNGKVLQSGRTLSDYNLKPSCTVHVVCRQAGGECTLPKPDIASLTIH